MPKPASGFPKSFERGLLLTAPLAWLLACGSDPVELHTIGGVVTGLTDEVVLINGFDELTVAASGEFAFAEEVATGDRFEVRVLQQPAAGTCAVSNGSGIVSDQGVSGLSVDCLSTNVDLASLTVSRGELDPEFATDVATYSVELGAWATEISVSAESADPDATVSIDGQPATGSSASSSLVLEEGANRVEVVVTSPEGTSRSYVALVQRNRSADQQYFKAFDAAPSDFYGRAVAISGDTLAVGAPGRDIGEDEDRGAVYVYRRSGDTWNEEELLLSATQVPSAELFGFRVAVRGDTLVVGSPGESNGEDDDVGAAYVYQRANGLWGQPLRLSAATRIPLSRFGASVALDDDLLVVGEPGTVGGGDGPGRAHIYRRVGDTWTSETILAPDLPSGSGFGFDVAVDDDVVAVSARYEAANRGAVYVFRESGGTWNQEAHIVAQNRDVNDYFGTSLGLSDGHLAVGAIFEDSPAVGIYSTITGNSTSGTDSGAVYTFVNVGGQWLQQAYIKAPTRMPEAIFGWDLSLSGDMLAVSAAHAPTNALRYGMAFVYLRDASGQWSHQDSVTALVDRVNDYFGESICVDGESLAVGVHGEDSASTTINGSPDAYERTNSGAVYIFR